MRDQIGKILELSKRDNLTVQVMPLAVPGNPGLPGAFTLLEYQDPSETIVSVDTVAGNVIIEGAERLQICARSFAKMRSITLGPTASRSRLKVAMASYEERIGERTPDVEEEQQEQPGRRMRRGE